MTKHAEAVEKLRGDDAYYSAIGRFVEAFSHLENDLKLCLYMRLGLQADDAPLVLNQDFAMLCTMGKSLFTTTAKEDAPEIIAVLNACYDMNIDRVKIAHGVWLVDKDGTYLSHRNRSLVHNLRTFESAKDLAVLADECVSIHRRLWTAMNKVNITRPG